MKRDDDADRNRMHRFVFVGKSDEDAGVEKVRH